MSTVLGDMNSAEAVSWFDLPPVNADRLERFGGAYYVPMVDPGAGPPDDPMVDLSQVPDYPPSDYRVALVWVGGIVDAIQADQFDLPTPCADWNVRTLLGHLLADLRGSAEVGAGRSPNHIPDIITDVPDDGWQAAYAGAIEAAERAWDDEALNRVSPSPLGEVNGRFILMARIVGALTHGWDLATATGQAPTLPGGLADRWLPIVTGLVPAHRDERMPFAAPVAVTDDADATTRMMAWLGRH